MSLHSVSIMRVMELFVQICCEIKLKYVDVHATLCTECRCEINLVHCEVHQNLDYK